jgi:hypothetical protein
MAASAERVAELGTAKAKAVRVVKAVRVAKAR